MKKVTLMLSLVVAIFAVTGTSMFAYANEAAPEPSQDPVSGFVEGTGKCIAGFGEGTGKCVSGFTEGTGQVLTGMGNAMTGK